MQSWKMIFLFHSACLVFHKIFSKINKLKNIQGFGAESNVSYLQVSDFIGSRYGKA